MSTNTLETSYTNGDIIDASHVNELSLALLGSMVGRDASGVPTPSQNLGTLAIPWGNVYADGLIINGSALDTTQLDAKPNRVVSGKARSTSSMPDFLRANGAALSFQILGATTNLVLSINNTATTVDSDLTTTGVSAAPATNNTALVNDTTIVNDLYAGEEDAAIDEITIDTVGSEISALVGQMAAFKTATGEIFKAFVKDATTLTNVFRGYYFNDSGNPIERGNLSNNDTLTLMKIGWVFVEDNGSTVDVSYLTPVVSFTAPGSPATGQYWFDISNQTWKRYSGTTFEIIDRILVGEIVSDDTNTIASRSRDFDKPYEEFNNLEVEIDTVEIIKSQTHNAKVNVYGKELFLIDTQLNWNMTTDLESGVTEAADTDYYLYLSEDGERIISDIRPHLRKDLKGYYHPFNSWRCVGVTHNETASDLVVVSEIPYNSEIEGKEIYVKDAKPSGTDGGTFTSGAWRTRDLNTLEGDTGFLNLSGNQLTLLPGKHEIEARSTAFRVADHKLKLRNITKGSDEIIGESSYVTTVDNVATSCSFTGEVITNSTAVSEIQHYCATSRSSNGFGFSSGFGVDEIYTQVKIKRIK